MPAKGDGAERPLSPPDTLRERDRLFYRHMAMAQSARFAIAFYRFSVCHTPKAFVTKIKAVFK
ncbi:hypothetical protein [Scytonema sp. HK-05]|uniref:hypothetical protein n=1 Tax=Scytonema sp. HK-05 TaxID=1137095 RepID=UPI001E5DE84D|nr:hypothetical protein [Scytonema sp. HK-05]